MSSPRLGWASRAFPKALVQCFEKANTSQGCSNSIDYRFSVQAPAGAYTVPRATPKIPDVCDDMGIAHLELVDVFRREGFSI